MISKKFLEDRFINSGQRCQDPKRVQMNNKQADVSPLLDTYNAQWRLAMRPAGPLIASRIKDLVVAYLNIV